MRVYDPCVGSGGMLILSKQYVEEHGGNATNLRLYGQDNNGGVWSMCKMNMLLHGIHDPEIHNDDTLWNPLHLEGGELMRFDRVITNPPFSQNYSRDGMKFPERFRYGFCPETGKKADLMFLQHMLSVLRTSGMVATVMPHGVLFRGSVEREIRRGIVEDDLLEAVIGLPPNLFYGTGIPACILVCRAKGAKPDERRNRVLFINADAEFHAGRAQNYLRPEHIEKIVSTYEAFKKIPGYASVVSRDELKENEWNLNIRRYADNAAPPEPHDVRAHIVGGVPKAEVEAKKDLLSAHGLKVETVFVERDVAYYDFDPTVKDRGEIKRRIENGKGVQAKEKKIKQGKRTKVSEGDLLISITADLGIIGVIPTGFGEAYINQHIALVRLDRNVANPRWIGNYLAFGPPQEEFRRLNDQGAKAGMNLPTVGTIMVAKPGIEEQGRIASVIDAHEAKIHKEQQYLNKLKLQKKGLMHDLLTGKVRVSVDTTAENLPT